MSAATRPTTLEAAHQLIEQLQWRVAQLEKELYGPSSERQADTRRSKEQILLSLFPAPAQPAATQQVLVRLDRPAAEQPERSRRQPALKVLETVTERIEPAENFGAVEVIVLLDADAVEPRTGGERAVDAVAGGKASRPAAGDTDPFVIVRQFGEPGRGFHKGTPDIDSREHSGRRMRW